MFDFSAGEVIVIGVVALVVIGPERLPTVARTVGTLLGRAQRYLSSVKAEVEREIELENLRKMEADMNDRGRQLGQDISGAFEDTPHVHASTGEDAHLAPPEPVKPAFVPPPRDRR
ncbi:Sec-independent protein translocase protein TatB [Burkholderiaceae bacterium DAT-1]|nr:Sec-independent protein translocase protein TatB [Burkholderiaceae bacterium DAT-1]